MENNLKYLGKLRNIYAIYTVNYIFQLLTLSLYRPWAKTKLRKFFYNNVSIFNERIEYSGRGGELFKGFLIALIFLFITSSAIFLVISLLIDNPAILKHSQEYLPSILLFPFIYYAQYSSLKYRLTRSRWKSIGAFLKGSSFKYMLFKIKRLFINIMTLGFYIGRSDLLSKQYMVNNASIGSIRFEFKESVKVLDKVNVITLLLALPTLFISRICYQAYLKNCSWGAIKIANISFKGDFTTKKILCYYLGNIFILIAFCIIMILCFAFVGKIIGFENVTREMFISAVYVYIFVIIITFLPIIIPIFLQRKIKFFSRNIYILGSIADIEILQEQKDHKATGDELADILGFELDLDIGLL
jgi:uncharacterized membrane protein YjgN (DUF898 family)